MKIQPSDLGIEQWRPHQYEAIRNSLSSPKRFVGQCSPVGNGKSHMLLGEAIESGKRTLILTSSRELQKQYAELFKHLNILDVKGKTNYQCRAMELGGEFYDGSPAKNVADAPCQFGEECSLKLGGCTYYDKVREACYRRIVSTNYAAWISANMYTEGWGKFDLICADEGHSAEDWLAAMLAVRLPRCHANLIGTKFPNTTNVAIWAKWAARELPNIRAAVRIEKRAIQHNKRKRITKLRTLQSFENSLSRLQSMTQEWRIFPNNSYVLFQPIWVHEYAERLLFNGADKVVFASSTIVPNTLNLLGILDCDMDFFSYPSMFPPERRPIYYYPVTKMHFRMSEEEKQECIAVADRFISQRLDRKGLICTTSYVWQEVFLKYSKFVHLMVASSPSYAQGGSTSSASMTLQRFRASPTPSILIGPNWNTGIDLPGKQCNYTIISKVPFGDITDPLHMARSEDNPDYGWYNAGMTLTQAIGRAMRSADDTDEILIFDEMFGKFMTKHRRMLPDWAHSAIRRVYELPEPLEL